MTRFDGVHRKYTRPTGSEKELPRKGMLVNAGERRFKSSVASLGAFPTGLCRSCTYSMGYVSFSCPGARAPARSDGEHRPASKTRVQERWESKTLLRRNREGIARYGRSRKNIVHVAYGGIVVRDFF